MVKKPKDQGIDKAATLERLAKLGEARRALLGKKATANTKKLGKRIAELAGKQGAIVEWTLRPLNPSESAGVACGCFCGCGCSCIA
ncbi:MAG: hypothetical protein AABO58_17130 [Acidobacteriota bacterium]